MLKARQASPPPSSHSTVPLHLALYAARWALRSCALGPLAGACLSWGPRKAQDTV